MTDIAIVTGSSSGVGAATVVRLLRAGHAVFGIDVAESPPHLDSELKPMYRHVHRDAGASQTWADVLEACQAEFGSAPHAVVFNAAKLVIGSSVSLTEEDWQDVFHVNVFGPARALKVLIPAMTVCGGGSIVFVNSSDGLVAEQNLAAYCASKGAALQLMRAVAVDHARQGIRSNAVCPGSIETPFFMRHVDAAPDPAAFLEAKTQRHPAGRLIQPDDVAAVVEFLVSDGAVGVTGVAMPVDGGLTTTFDFYPDQARDEAALARTLAGNHGHLPS